MKSKKILQKSIYCSACLLILALTGLNIYQYQQNKKLAAKITLNKLPKIVEANVPEQSGKKSFTNKNDSENKKKDFKISEINELEYQLNASEEELNMAHEALSDELLKKAEYKKAIEENAKSILSNPAFNKNKKGIIALTINNNYGPLFQKLNLSKDESAELKGMLVDQMMDIEQITGATLISAASDEEKSQAIQQAMDTRKKYEDRIKAFLGEKNSETYQSYEFRLADRINLNEFIETLSPENKINEEQAENIIDSMYEARKAVYSEMFSMNNTNSTSESKDKSLTRMIEKNVRTNEKYIEVCNGLLSTDQMKQFKAYLEKKQAMETSGLKMNNYFYSTN